MTYRISNSIKDRKNREFDGFRNWDMVATYIVLRRDKLDHLDLRY